MAEKGWTTQVAAAAGVAAGTGAAQLGLGYGLGVVVWPVTPADDTVWLGSLGWATWIAASATVFGAVIAGRLGRVAGGPWRFALAASAAVGAMLTVALIAIPARAAVRTDTYAPQTIAAGYAVLGVLLGLVIAYWAVVSRPVAANLIATAAWLWTLAIAAVVADIFFHRPSATFLSSWQFVIPDGFGDRYGALYWPSSLLTLLAAFVVGVIGALPAVRRGRLGLGTSSSGAVGPLLVAATFFVLTPQLTGALGPLGSAYLVAPYAVLTGLAGSALAVAFGRRRAARPDAMQRASRPGDTGEGSRSDGTEQDVRSPGTERGSRSDDARRLSRADGPPSGARAATPEEVAGSATASSVPAPRQAPAETVASDDSRPSGFLGRFRRGAAGQREVESPVAGAGNAGVTAADVDQREVATGRAKAPVSPIPQPATAPAGTGKAAPAGASKAPPAAAGKAAPVAARGAATASGKATPLTPSKAAPNPAASGRSAASAKSGEASADRAARPAAPGASAAPAKAGSRSTVAAPPPAPPVAKINPPRSGETDSPAARSAAASSLSGPADAASSDKTPPPRKAAARPRPAPRKAQPPDAPNS